MALRFSSPLLRLPLASARLLRQDRRHRLPLSTLRCFSTSPPPIPKDDTVSTKSYASKSLTKPKKLAKALNQVCSQETPWKPRPLQVVFEEEARPRTCLEVFDVRIQRFDGKRSSRIYGKAGLAYERPFYDRPMTNPESVHLGFSPLPLIGPERPLTISDPFEIKIDIKDADTDREIIHEDLYYHPGHSGPGRGYDKFIQEEVLGTHGSAVISYAVFKRAMSATIEVTLVNGGAHVHGVVAAGNSVMRQGQSVLFHNEKEQNVDVSPGGRVPLSRSVVSLPEDSDLNVRVELWDCDSEEIAIATATFQLRGRTSTKIIPGKIEVKVTWKYSWPCNIY